MEITSRINWVDVLVVIIMIRISYVAFMDGLSHEVFPFIGSVIMILFGLHYYSKIGNFISRDMINMPVEVSNFLGFLILIVAMGLVLKLLRSLLEKLIKIQWHPVIERFGGIAIGIMRAYITASIVLTLLALMPLSYLQWSIRDKSLTGKYVLMAGPEIYSRLSGLLPTIKMGDGTLTKDAISKNLLSDKSVNPKPGKKEKNLPADKLDS